MSRRHCPQIKLWHMQKSQEKWAYMQRRERCRHEEMRIPLVWQQTCLNAHERQTTTWQHFCITLIQNKSTLWEIECILERKWNEKCIFKVNSFCNPALYDLFLIFVYLTKSVLIAYLNNFAWSTKTKNNLITVVAYLVSFDFFSYLEISCEEYTRDHTDDIHTI